MWIKQYHANTKFSIYHLCLVLVSMHTMHEVIKKAGIWILTKKVQERII